MSLTDVLFLGFFVFLLLPLLVPIYRSEWRRFRPQRFERTRRRRSLRYRVDGEELYPAPLTLPAFRNVLDQIPDDQLGPWFLRQAAAELDGAEAKRQVLEQLDSLYDQLAALLLDRNNEHPDSSWLSAYIELDEAMDMLDELLSVVNRKPSDEAASL